MSKKKTAEVVEVVEENPLEEKGVKLSVAIRQALDDLSIVAKTKELGEFIVARHPHLEEAVGKASFASQVSLAKSKLRDPDGVPARATRNVSPKTLFDAGSLSSLIAQRAEQDEAIKTRLVGEVKACVELFGMEKVRELVNSVLEG